MDKLKFLMKTAPQYGVDIFPDQYNNKNYLKRKMYRYISHLIKRAKREYDIKLIDFNLYYSESNDMNYFIILEGSSENDPRVSEGSHGILFSIQFYTFDCGVKQLYGRRTILIPNDLKIIKCKKD